jgi:hypothetical protein
MSSYAGEIPNEVWTKIKEAGGLGDTRRSKIAQAMNDYRSDIRRHNFKRNQRQFDTVKGTANKLRGLIKSIYAKENSYLRALVKANVVRTCVF